MPTPNWLGRALIRTVLARLSECPLGSESDFPAFATWRIGFNVEFVSTDFAGMIQRRVNRDTIDKGGWSVFNSTYGGIDMRNPAVNALLRGAGPNSWFGWPTNPKLEELRTQWFGLTNPDDKMRVAHEIQVEAFKTLPYIPLCYSNPVSAWSKKLTGVTKGPIATFWDIGKLD
jgi:peptide/nickel transport system substrate-binding protein